MDFTKKDIENYIEKRRKLEMQLYEERAYGNASKNTLRKIEELDRIIYYDGHVKEVKELRQKVIYYQDLLKKHNIQFDR